VKLSVFAVAVFLLFALDPAASRAQNTRSDYAYVEREVADVVEGTVGSGSGDYQLSERRMGMNKISYERPFFRGQKYYIHAVGAEQASRMKIEIVCNNYRVLDEAWSTNAVGAMFEPPHGNTETCTIRAFVARSKTPDKSHVIGLAIMYSEENP
jgi:hypothetical protein